MTLQAFHNNLQLQKEFLDRAQSHYDADELIHGVYWEEGKGCAYGCMTHSNNHKDLELLYGMPEWIGRVVDVLFEGMENKYSKKFYLNFIRAVAKPLFLGFDNWQHIFHQLCLHILQKECKNIDHPLVKQEICDVITLHRTEEIDQTKWAAAGYAVEYAAESTAESVEYAVESTAGYAVEYAALSAGSTAGSTAESAAWSARSAARSTAWSTAESVEYAVESAARSTAWSAGSTALSAAESAALSTALSAALSAGSTRSAAESAAYKSIADKLIELLKA